MKIFPNFNQNGPPCLICKTNADKPCVLIPIDRTREGNKEKAIAVHVDCIDLRYVENGIIYQSLREVT
jgi:hypothetical protein